MIYFYYNATGLEIVLKINLEERHIMEKSIFSGRVFQTYFGLLASCPFWVFFLVKNGALCKALVLPLIACCDLLRSYSSTKDGHHKLCSHEVMKLSSRCRTNNLQNNLIGCFLDDVSNVFIGSYLEFSFVGSLMLKHKWYIWSILF